MQSDLPIEKHLSNNQLIPPHICQAARDVTDNLEIAKKIADSIFGDDVAPEIIMQIYASFLERIAVLEIEHEQE